MRDFRKYRVYVSKGQREREREREREGKTKKQNMFLNVDEVLQTGQR